MNNNGARWNYCIHSLLNLDVKKETLVKKMESLGEANCPIMRLFLYSKLIIHEPLFSYISSPFLLQSNNDISVRKKLREASPSFCTRQLSIHFKGLHKSLLPAQLCGQGKKIPACDWLMHWRGMNRYDPHLLHHRPLRVGVTVMDWQYSRYKHCGWVQPGKHVPLFSRMSFLCWVLNNLSKTKCQLWGETEWWTSAANKVVNYCTFKVWAVRKERKFNNCVGQNVLSKTTWHKSMCYSNGQEGYQQTRPSHWQENEIAFFLKYCNVIFFLSVLSYIYIYVWWSARATLNL